ncbi:hypothetical protein [uncultured Clostridium sp.]|uniref:hypothetical protein n=1 Tax=uncultured Clostridium sp. TaxID=59620 RepID=UPI0028E95970|nr:hypothetical protein [uncultured Clostridium sp.]
MGFTLSNASSINLNFILYVINMYNEKSNSTGKQDKFLSMEELYRVVPSIWNNLIKRFTPINGRASNSSFIYWDKELLKQKDLYRTLFKDTEEGHKEYLNIWNQYSRWWYDECQSMINKKTDEFIPTIYNLVKNKLILNKGYLLPDNFAIEVVFSEIPKDCLLNGDLFTIESINNFSSESDVSEISERLYELILSKYSADVK